MDTVPPPIQRHRPYHTDPAYAEAVAELVDLQDTATPGQDSKQTH